ncbi:MAG: Hsp70 family protein [Labilithrix sp.]|nr:Hsp70 family protein [Labilithrix sp.]MCW5816419.1 Hsp70 family protein [Labilithrix sp.]
MNVQALVCCRCGGPLANPEALPALIDCLYCGTVNSATREATRASDDETAWEVRKKAIDEFTKALVAALEEGRSPLDACRAASAAHLGVAGRPDTVARIVLALARDFERDTRVSIVRDATVLSRIAQAYLRALDELRTSEDYDLNLPFLTANQDGPVHFRRKLTAKLLVELAARDPHQEPAPALAPEVPAPEKKKKGWWPFS